MLVVLPTALLGGAALAPEVCRRTLARASPSFMATGGRRHFFVLTQDRGPCCHGGQLIFPDFLEHHVIGNHGEVQGHHWFHAPTTPNLPCFLPHKDISIPTPNRRLSHRPTVIQGEKDLLAFFAGAGTGALNSGDVGMRMGRYLMLKAFGNRSDPGIVAAQHMSRADYDHKMARARFCPIFGGYAPWTPRLVEAVFAGCVPVIFSSWLPPFSSTLNWEQFSVRVGSLSLVPHLRGILERQESDEPCTSHSS